MNTQTRTDLSIYISGPIQTTKNFRLNFLHKINGLTMKFYFSFIYKNTFTIQIILRISVISGYPADI